MLVRHRMSQNPVTITPEDSLAAAQQKMQAGQFRRLPVIEDGKLIGIVTDRDIRQHLGMEDRTRVNSAMTERPSTVSPHMTVEEAARIMLTNKIGGLPVVEDGKLVGIITTSDVMQAFRDVMGASAEDSIRIDVIEQEGTLDLPAATTLIGELGGTVRGVGTYRDVWEDRPVFYVRFCGADENRVSTALQEKGYTVLGVHP